MNKKILVVDYEQKSLDEIQQFLKDEHFTILMAYDGNQALEIFETKNPDLVLTSALLPKLNGFELCKKITSGEHGEIRPVIMFSGIYKAEKYRKEAIIGCGAVDFLEKPLAKWQMLKVIKSLFTEIPYKQPARLTNEVQQSTTDDLLQIEPLLEGDHNKGLGKNNIYETGPSVLKRDLNDAKLLSPGDEDELGVVLDAVRIDLDLETRLRDQQVAQAIEAELSSDGQNVLEFETTMGLEGLSSNMSEAWPEIMELDSDTASPDTKAGVEPAIRPASRAKPGTGETAVPTFAFSSPRPRNWIPFLIILAGLLVLVLFWMQSK